MSRKGWDRGRCKPHSMSMAGLGYRKSLVWQWVVILCKNGLRKQSSHLVEPSFQALKVFYSLDRWLLAKSTDY